MTANVDVTQPAKGESSIPGSVTNSTIGVSAEMQKKKDSAVKVVDLSGKRIRDDSNQGNKAGGQGDNESDVDSSSDDESLYVDNQNVAHEKPFPLCSFYNLVKLFMRLSLE